MPNPHQSLNVVEEVTLYDLLHITLIFHQIIISCTNKQKLDKTENIIDDDQKLID